jgi:mono/diheme cytochrome c family protein
MTKATARLFAVTVALMAFTASSVAQSVRQHDPAWTAPPKEAGKPNPLADRTDVLAGARKLYGHRCNTCHGDDGGGTDRAPSLLSSEVQTQTDGALFWKITSGNTHAGMPAFSFLPEAQRWQLVLHLRHLAAEGIRARR